MLLTSSFDAFCITNVPHFGLYINAFQIRVHCFDMFYKSCFIRFACTILYMTVTDVYSLTCNTKTFKITHRKTFHGKSDLEEFNCLLHIYLLFITIYKNK